MLKIVREDSNNMWARCPKHKDSRPSLMITKTGEFKGIFKCFSCGWSGKAAELGINIETSRQPKRRQKIDWYSIWLEQHKLATEKKDSRLCKEWDVSFGTLWNYGVGLILPDTCTLPMVNEKKTIIGIQQRFENGRKVCMKGSRLGIFCPQAWPDDLSVCYITEGGSDCCVAYELTHKLVIGRPNASAVPERIVGFCKRWLSKQCKIIIVSDTNDVGTVGTADLVIALDQAGFLNVKTLFPRPYGDLREMYQKNKQETLNLLEAI